MTTLRAFLIVAGALCSLCHVALADSPCKTVARESSGELIDSQNNVWTIAGGIVYENGASTGNRTAAVALAYVNQVVYGEVAGGALYYWGSFAPGYGPNNIDTWLDTWVSTATNPMSLVCASPPALSGSYANVNLWVQSGLILKNGVQFRGRGIAVADFQLPYALASSSGKPEILALFPAIQMVRITCYSYTKDTPAYLEPYVNALTSAGIVVEIENTMGPNGDNFGGGVGSYAGGPLTTETNWYATLAAAFRNNPYVWFATLNEPGGPTSQIVAEQAATYHAIRAAGNRNNIVLEETGGWSNSGFSPSVYSGMSNVIWDTHVYGSISSYSADTTVINNDIAQRVQQARLITSADGLIPVIIGEYGNSTTGGEPDANGDQITQVVGQTNLPSMAWAWGFGSGGDDIVSNENACSPRCTLTAYGNLIARNIAQHAP